MKILNVFLLTVLLAFTVSARLSETEKDAESRYGKAVCESKLDDGFISRYYIKGAFLVSIVFNKQNKSVNISYGKLDTSNKFYQESLSGKQYSDIVNYKKFFAEKLDLLIINHLLNVNSDSKEWTEIIKGDFWRRSDGVEAMYDKESKTFSISSEEYMKYVKQNVGKDLMGF
jgi:hypothetical protein